MPVRWFLNLLHSQVPSQVTPCRSRSKGLPWQQHTWKRSISCTSARPARKIGNGQLGNYRLTTLNTSATTTLRLTPIHYTHYCHIVNQLHNEVKPQGKSLSLGPPNTASQIGQANQSPAALVYIEMN